MSKKIYLLLFFIPLFTCLAHFHNVLPDAAGEILGWIFSGILDMGNILCFIGGLYYFLINYHFFKNSLKKAFLFSILGLSMWWGFEALLYFAVGQVDNVGIFILKCFFVYNYILLFFVWGITYLVRKKKKR